MERLAAIYSRVSTEEQAQTSGVPSTATQVERCRARAKLLGIPVVAEGSDLIVEETHSGADLRWEGTKFMALVRRAQRHEFTDLIVLSVDRFSRAGIWALGEQMGYFKDAKVGIHFVEGAIPEPGPQQEIMLANMAWAAQQMRETARDASTRVREANAAKGEFMPGHAPPFGFEWVEDPTRKTRKDKPVKIGLRPHPIYGQVLLRMYEHIAAGGSVWSLAHALDAEGIPTPRGAPTWHPSSIRRILHNPTNWGERRTFMTKETPRPDGVRRPADMKTSTWHRPTTEEEQHEPTLAKWEPIAGLTRDLALRAVAQLAANAENSRRRATHTPEEMAERGLLFNGWVRCGVCQRGLRLKRSGTSRNSWLYICFHTGTEHQGENAISISTRTLDRYVWSVASQAISDPDFFEAMLAKTDEVAGAAARAGSLQRQLEDSARESDNLFKQLRRLDQDDPENA
ncbi:MAG TPA: recombinase family protein, partial [Ktedonobacterales bacterium]